MNGILKKTLKKFDHDFKGFSQDEEVAKINQVLVDMGNNFNPDVHEGDFEELLEMVPKGFFFKQQLFKLQEELMAEEEAREKKLLEEEKRTPTPRKFTGKGLTRTFVDLNKFLKKQKSMDCYNYQFSLIDGNAPGVLSAYKQIYSKKKETNKQTTEQGTMVSYF